MKERLNLLLEDSIKEHWSLKALSNFQAEDYTFADVAGIIAHYHKTWKDAGLNPGFRVALCGRPSAEWSIGLLAAFTYGAVAVPLLNDFTPDMIERLVVHSESEVLLVGPVVIKGLDCDRLLKDTCLKSIVCVADKITPLPIEKDQISYYKHEPEDLLMINYTSGTTSEPKGVMIPERAMWSNMEFAQHVLPNLHAGLDVLSMLPTAHLYGMSFELMYEFVVGIHVTFLNRALSPKILMMALKGVRPHLIVVVPMLIEKIIRKGIMPKYNSPLVKVLRHIPFVSSSIKRKFRDGLMDALGGRLYEVIIGGAALNAEIESILKDIKFPYTVGYGMTECAPIIGYEDWQKFVPTSCGKPALNMEVKIDSADPMHQPGEILTRGMNVMLGYYKNEEATARTIDSEGWLHTGDMGVMDAEKNIFIRGRIKNMLLSASGQNVYPEEIESEVNNMPNVVESVVVQRDLRMIALVFPDRELAKKAGLVDDAAILANLKHHIKSVNKKFPVYSQVNDIELVEKEFEKTPKKSIKRFMYK